MKDVNSNYRAIYRRKDFYEITNFSFTTSKILSNDLGFQYLIVCEVSKRKFDIRTKLSNSCTVFVS